MSVASLLGTAAMPLAYVGIALAAGWPVFGEQWPLLAFALLIAFLIVFKHRGNIARLRAGTELRLARRPHRNGDGGHNGNGDGNGDGNGQPQDEPGGHGKSGEGNADERGPGPPGGRRMTNP